MKKKVFVSGCFDEFHAGHAEFFRQASEYGDIYAAVGSDKNVFYLKDLKPTFNEKERAFIVGMIKGVKKAFVSSGIGKLDFVNELNEIKPNIFIVNADGDSKEKEELCKKLKIKYIVLKRIPKKGLPIRSSTEMRARKSKIPYRIDLAGGWLDQPYVSKKYPGGVITISIEPTQFFDFRSGFASSTRNKAIKMWGSNLPEGNPADLAKMLFSSDNLPGTKIKDVAGAQDSIGIAFPGLAYSYFEGKYWPKKINVTKDEKILSWLEDRIFVVKLSPRKEGYDVFKEHNISRKNAKQLSLASKNCLNAILKRDFELFAEAFIQSFESQRRLFPSTVPEEIIALIEKYRLQGAKGWKLSGAGGGGYLILLSEKPIKGAIKVKIRRK